MNRRNEAIYSQSCFSFFLSPSSHCVCWLRHYLELQTLCVNIAYNVTLNMQICTAQHLISHLSVKVPSVGSPGGPGLMSWRVPDRNMQKEEEGRRVKEKEEGGRSKHLLNDMFCYKHRPPLFRARLNIWLKVRKQMQRLLLEINGWMLRKEELCCHLLKSILSCLSWKAEKNFTLKY